MLLNTSPLENQCAPSEVVADPLPLCPSATGGLSWPGSCKSFVEFVLAAILLVLAAPIILLAAFLVKVTSHGPAFYSQTRLGRGGKPYRILKIRTMFHNCESRCGPQWSAPQDRRITRIGRFLRRAHIDELPQLYNVLRGEMSLVGPRPERPEFVPILARAIPCYQDRLLVRPGLTGLAQVQLPPDTELASVRRKLAYDLYYVDRLSFWLDARILLATALYLVGVPFYRVPALFRVPGGDTVEQAYEALAAEVGVVPQVQPA